MIDYRDKIEMKKSLRESIRTFPSDLGKAALAGLIFGGFLLGLEYFGAGPKDYNKRMQERYSQSELIPESGATSFQEAYNRAKPKSELVEYVLSQKSN